jgi:hypothetical protein
MPASIYMNGKYLALNPTWHVEHSPWKANQVLTMIAKHNIQPRTIAEIGCGAGEILHQLSLNLRETSFCGFDISEEAIALARTRQTEHVHFFQLDFCDSKGTFDLLLLMDVIEHVEDCFGLLRGVRERAEYKIMHIPLQLVILQILRNSPMKSRKSAGHIHYFAKQTALALLEDTGYQVLDWVYTPVYQMGPRDIAHRAINVLHSLTMKIAPDFSQMMLGGCSLLVLAR